MNSPYAIRITRPSVNATILGFNPILIKWLFSDGRMHRVRMRTMYKGRILTHKSRIVATSFLLDPSKWGKNMPDKKLNSFEIFVFITGEKICNESFQGDITPKSKLCCYGFAYIKFYIKKLLSRSSIKFP